MLQDYPSAFAMLATVLFFAVPVLWAVLRYRRSRPGRQPQELEEALSVDDWILMGDDSLGVMHMGPVNAKFVSATDGKTVQVRLKHPFGGTHVSIRPDPDRPGKNMKTQFGTDLPFVGFEEP